MDASTIMQTIPLAATLGMELVDASPDEVTGRLEWRAELCTTGGLLHGGALMSFADTLGAICAFLNLPAGAGTATIESKTNFFRGLRAGHLTGTARPLHVGRTTIAVQTELQDGAGKLAGMVTQTQAVLLPRD